MPSIYLKKARLSDVYDVVLPFGRFRVGRNTQNHAPDALDSDQFSYGDHRITHGQFRLILAERDRLVEADTVRILAANAERDATMEQLARSALNRSERRNAGRYDRLQADLKKKRARIDILQSDVDLIEAQIKLLDDELREFTAA